MVLSIIIPIQFSESEKTILECLNCIFSNIKDQKNLDEIIMVSNKQIKLNNFKFDTTKIKYLIDKKYSTRAKAMNIGFKKIKEKNKAIFLHVDTLLPKNYDELIINKLSKVDFCFFKLKFNHSHMGFRIIELQVNNFRKFPYGDQCFCVNYDFHKKYDYYDDYSFLEDYLYVLKIPESCRYNEIDEYILTSPRRYKNENGYSLYSIFSNVNNNKILLQKYHQSENIEDLGSQYYKNGLLSSCYYQI